MLRNSPPPVLRLEERRRWSRPTGSSTSARVLHLVELPVHEPGRLPLRRCSARQDALLAGARISPSEDLTRAPLRPVLVDPDSDAALPEGARYSPAMSRKAAMKLYSVRPHPPNPARPLLAGPL